MKRNNSRKSWGKMTAGELAEATREFDRPLPASRYKPANKPGQKRFQRALHAGALGLDPRLLKKALAYARRNNLTMLQLVERGLRREMAVDE